MKASTIAIAALLVLTTLEPRAWTTPPSRQEADRQGRVVEDLKTSLANETTAAGKVAVVARVVNAEPDPHVRELALENMAQFPGPELDTLLARVLAGDADAGVRGWAATLLGRVGSETCLPALARAAGADRTTEIRRGCMVGQSSARRSATFAIAELASRFPLLAEKAANELRALRPAADPKDGESLADARAQALYQITRDEALLRPFFERLRSQDARVREGGVIAFRFLKIKSAPAELVAAMNDADGDVRSWTALVLGEIGDPKTVPVLLAAAEDPHTDLAARCNAIGALGRMKAAAAVPLMRKLLMDANPSVQSNAAIALYRMTGEKAKSFPTGYNAD